ncbi:MAG: hypothetical protein ABID04_00825 [Patescibacteria group bacterium]
MILTQRQRLSFARLPCYTGSMSQLTIVSYYTRKGIKIGAIVLTLLIVGRVSLTLAINYWKKLHPPPPPPADTAFGKLPNINFPRSNKPKPANFQLETIEGGLPSNFPEQVKVFFIPQIGGRFLSLEKANKMADGLGFGDQPQKLSENEYLYTNSLNNTKLNVNVLTESFQYQYSYLTDQTLIHPPYLPPKSEAISVAQGFLERVGKLTPELSDGQYQSSYWKIIGTQLVPAAAPSEADFVRVDVSRQEISDPESPTISYPIALPNPDQSLISLLISGVKVQSKNVIEANYTFFPVDRQKLAGYPGKLVEQAWEELKAGNFFLASYAGNEKETVKIRKVFLAYYEPQTSSHFLQPIFVFQGDANFQGYVPAVSSEWTE